MEEKIIYSSPDLYLSFPIKKEIKEEPDSDDYDEIKDDYPIVPPEFVEVKIESPYDLNEEMISDEGADEATIKDSKLIVEANHAPYHFRKRKPRIKLEPELFFEFERSNSDGVTWTKNSATKDLFKERKFNPARKRNRCTLQSCEQCEKQFGSGVYLKLHMKTAHQNYKTYKCSLCKYSTPRRDYLENHVNKIHKNPNKLFNCHHCGSTFTMICNLKSHILKIHMKDGDHLLKMSPYNCSLCDYTARRRVYLEKHIISVHKEDKPFKCHYCTLSFQHNDHLQNHMKMSHLKQLTFACSYCDYICLKACALNRHIRNIHREQSFKCTCCKYTTEQSDYLEYHIRKFHNKWKDGWNISSIKLDSGNQILNVFKCTFCKYTTEQSDYFKCHIRKCHSKSKDG